MIQSLTHKVRWRYDFVRNAGELCMLDRLAHIAPQPERSREALIDRTVRKNPDGESYFQLRDLRILYLPRDLPCNENSHYRSARTVMIESFLCADEFYSSNVDIKPGDVVLDVGAYIGTCAINFARRTGPTGMVYAFEPVMSELVARNLEENHIANAELVAAAVSDSCGEIEMMVGEQVIDSSLARKPGKVTETRRVPMTSLDAFAEARQLERVDFIKVDIEGAEELAIRGAEMIMERHRPVWSISSYHTDHEGDAQHPKLMRLLAEEYGYQVEERFEQGKPTRILAWKPRKVR